MVVSGEAATLLDSQGEEFGGSTLGLTLCSVLGFMSPNVVKSVPPLLKLDALSVPMSAL